LLGATLGGKFSLSNPSAFKKDEVKKAYNPVAAALTTSMQTLNRQKGNPEDLYIIKDDGSKGSTSGDKVTGYLDKARQIVREAWKV
jgi:hypothetical protein